MRSSSSNFPTTYLLRALFIYSMLQLIFLGLAPIAGSTEAREAQVIDTIIRDQEWVLPLRNRIIPSKPPLYHWIGATISTVTGTVNEFTVRLPSHLAALGVLIFASLSAFRLARFSTTIEGDLHAERVALVAPAILSLTYGFHQLASQAMVDMTFTLCLWGALTALLWSDPLTWQHHRRLSAASRALFWCAIALAMLARGPVGAALPLLLAGVAGMYLAGFWATVREALRPSVGWIALAVPAAWYFAAYERGGDAFLERQLFFENVQRIVGGEKINTEAWWFYIPSLLRTTAPWGVLMVVWVWMYWRKARSLSYLGGFKRWTLVPTVTLLAGLLLLSLSSGKRHSYTLPLQPFVAIQCALLFSMILERRGLPLREKLWRVMGRVEAYLAVTIVIILIAIGLAFDLSFGVHPMEEILKFACAPLAVVCGMAVLVTLTAIGSMRRRGPGYPYARVWVLMLLLLTIGVSAGNVIKGTLKGWPLITEQLLALAKPDQTIIVIKDPFDEYFDPIFYYAHRPISIIDASRPPHTCDPSALYVARKKWLETIRDRGFGKTRRVATLQEIKKAFLGGKGEDLEVFVCSPGSSRAEPEVSTSPLRDA